MENGEEVRLQINLEITAQAEEQGGEGEQHCLSSSRYVVFTLKRGSPHQPSYRAQQTTLH